MEKSRVSVVLVCSSELPYGQADMAGVGVVGSGHPQTPPRHLRFRPVVAFCGGMCCTTLVPPKMTWSRESACRSSTRVGLRSSMGSWGGRADSEVDGRAPWPPSPSRLWRPGAWAWRGPPAPHSAPRQAQHISPGTQAASGLLCTCTCVHALASPRNHTFPVALSPCRSVTSGHLDVPMP